MSEPTQYAKELIENRKVLTYRLNMDGGSGSLIDTSLKGIIAALEAELENTPFDDDDDPIIYSVTIEKVFTQTQLDEMGEFDGF